MQELTLRSRDRRPSGGLPTDWNHIRFHRMISRPASSRRYNAITASACGGCESWNRIGDCGGVTSLLASPGGRRCGAVTACPSRSKGHEAVLVADFRVQSHAPLRVVAAAVSEIRVFRVLRIRPKAKLGCANPSEVHPFPMVLHPPNNRTSSAVSRAKRTKLCAPEMRIAERLPAQVCGLYRH